MSVRIQDKAGLALALACCVASFATPRAPHVASGNDAGRSRAAVEPAEGPAPGEADATRKSELRTLPSPR